MRQLGIASLFLVLSSVGYGRTTAFLTEFYVDPSFTGSTHNGQAATPWTSLGGGSGAAWTAINQALAAGDVAVYFSARQAGSDTNELGNWELYLYRYNTSSTRLTLDGMSRYNANDASPNWLSYSGSSRFQITGVYPISTYDVSGTMSYVTIRGFRVISTGGQLLQYGHGGSHVIIENNEFSAASTATIGAGVAFGDVPGTTDLTIRNNVIHDTFGEGIYIGGHSYTVGSPMNLDGVLIENNHIYNVGRWGGEGDCIDFKAGLRNVVARKNVCHNNQGGNATGISSLSPLTADGNVIYSTAGHGICFGTPGIVRNNVVFNVPGKCGIYSCDSATLPVNTSITNNTIYACGSGMCIGAESASSAWTIKNNIVMNCGTGIGGWVPSAGMASYVVSFNDFLGNTTTYAWPFYNGTFFPTIGKDNLYVDPHFVNAGNPAGADGTFGTGDDGFMLQAGSPVATAGAGGTYIGALPPVGGSSTIDLTDPSIPTNLAASAVSSSQINLSWTASTDNVGVTGYNVYRDGVLLCTRPAPGCSDTGLSPSTKHTYAVAAYDASGNLSALSTTASATTLASTPPPPPPPPPDTSGPTLAFVSPTNGQTVRGEITVTVSATDPSGVKRVEFYANGTLKSTDYAAPWTFVMGTKHFRGEGLTLTAKAYDSLGNMSSASITVKVAR